MTSVTRRRAPRYDGCGPGIRAVAGQSSSCGRRTKPSTRCTRCSTRGIFSFLARLARSRDIAEDLLEETWLRLVASARHLRPDTRLGPWLFTVARNLHISYCRIAVARSDAHGGSHRTLALRHDAVVAVRGNRRRGVGSAGSSPRSRRFPIAYREVLLLVGVEGLQPSEAAAICGVTPETLRQRLRRARVMLLQRLESTTPSRMATVSEVTTMIGQRPRRSRHSASLASGNGGSGFRASRTHAASAAMRWRSRPPAIRAASP